MAKYNLNDRQQRIVRELVAIYDGGFDHEFLWDDSGFLVFGGDVDAIRVLESDLITLRDEGFVTLRREDGLGDRSYRGVLRQLAQDAVENDFEQGPASLTGNSVNIGNFIQTMTGGNVQGAAGNHISMTQNVDEDLSALTQRFEELTDQLTEIFTQSLKGSELRDALAEISAVNAAIKDASEDTAVVARKSRSLGERLLALLDIGDKTSGTIQTAIYATEALVVLGGWLNTAYQIVQQIAR